MLPQGVIDDDSMSAAGKTNCDVTLQFSSVQFSSRDVKVTLKMHDLKMTDKENYGSGKCKSGK